MWFVGRDAFLLCNTWSRAIALEREIQKLREGVWAELKRYEAWWVPVAKSDTSLVHMPVEGQPHGFAFTAPDHYNRFPASVGSQADQVKSLIVPGSRLFSFVLQTKLGGLLINGQLPLNRDALDLGATSP
ncbi:MAG: hypothetical protein DI536_05975 [Archangium gephyra]|uniref:Uncharacterized protein n=1 Tax=Archangium gephyra TaxID=48 RepID=A0A2W5TPY3_9BACT|nr:MAG: hypothetical protein DI536_05975 [Archangium gephyra]